MVDIERDRAQVELGEGIHASCKVPAQEGSAVPGEAPAAKADLSSLSSMLQSKWKGGASGPSKPEALREGQIRSFRIVKLDRETKKIEVDLV